jgi:hypothetical protein
MKKCMFLFLLVSALAAYPFYGATEASDVLKSARFFAIGGIGRAGMISNQENALRTILKRKEAVARFHSLLSTATPSGQLYALLGLKLLSAEDFERCAEPYLESVAKVDTFQGCIEQPMAVSTIAHRIETGYYPRSEFIKP